MTKLFMVLLGLVLVVFLAAGALAVTLAAYCIAAEIFSLCSVVRDIWRKWRGVE